MCSVSSLSTLSTLLSISFVSAHVLAVFTDVGLCNFFADALGSHLWLPRLWAASDDIWARVRGRALLFCELAWNVHLQEEVITYRIIEQIRDEELERWLRAQDRLPYLSDSP